MSSILPQLCRRLHFGDTLSSFALRIQLRELLPEVDVPSQALDHLQHQVHIVPPPPSIVSVHRALLFDTSPPPYRPREISLTPSAEDGLLRLLLPVIVLGVSACIPSLLLALILLVLTLRALLLYAQRLHRAI